MHVIYYHELLDYRFHVTRYLDDMVGISTSITDRATIIHNLTVATYILIRLSISKAFNDQMTFKTALGKSLEIFKTFGWAMDTDRFLSYLYPYALYDFIEVERQIVSDTYTINHVFVFHDTNTSDDNMRHCYIGVSYGE